jgi:hypothetical protein
MSRPERPIDPLWPLASFASGLRAVRQKRGIACEEMSDRAHYCRSALSTAPSGRRLPSREVKQAYAVAYDGPIADWRARRCREKNLKRDRSGTSHG